MSSNMKKTDYSKELTLPFTRLTMPDGSPRFFRTFKNIKKTYLCDMAKANACQKRARWYGYDTIGPRVYAVYRCADHGDLKVRLQ